jgi:uncharacterized protein YggU (UPF0235/DUF167 family)
MIVRVIVRSSANADTITFNEGSDTYLVSVKARPIDGEANAAIIGILSKHLDVPKSLITLKSGSKSKIKLFEIK